MIIGIQLCLFFRLIFRRSFYLLFSCLYAIVLVIIWCSMVCLLVELSSFQKKTIMSDYNGLKKKYNKEIRDCAMKMNRRT